MTLTREQMRLVGMRYKHNPAAFCREVLHSTPYPKQIEMVESVRDNEQTSVAGANAVGKDYMTGRIIAWWQATHYPAKTILTGPTARQVADIVWREFRIAFYAADPPLDGRVLPVEARWEVDDEHFALGFSTDRSWNLTGFHSANLLVVVTEAHNFSDADLVSLKRLVPKRLLLTGNPFSDSGEFYASHHEKRHLYNAIAISAYDTPNLLEKREVIPGMVTERDIERWREDWGEDSPLFRATVLGEFVGAEDGLIPLAWLKRAEQREPVDNGADIYGGLDVAGPGEDATVLTIRADAVRLTQKVWVEADPRGAVLAALQPYRQRLKNLNVDAAGIGYYMGLHLADAGIPVTLVNVGEKARDPERFANQKAELYWGLRKRFEDDDVDGLDQVTMSQLAGIRYKHNSRGQVEIERKEDYKKRVGKSPDYAESEMLCYAQTSSRWTETDEIVIPPYGREF